MRCCCTAFPAARNLSHVKSGRALPHSKSCARNWPISRQRPTANPDQRRNTVFPLRLLFHLHLLPFKVGARARARERESVRLKILKQCLYLIFRVFDRLSPKKYRPPRPMDVKGGCSPQNNLRKLAASSRACVWSQQISAGTYATSRQLCNSLSQKFSRRCAKTPAV